MPKMVIDRGKDDQLKSECSSSASRSMDSFMTAMDKLRNVRL